MRKHIRLEKYFLIEKIYIYDYYFNSMKKAKYVKPKVKKIGELSDLANKVLAVTAPT